MQQGVPSPKCSCKDFEANKAMLKKLLQILEFNQIQFGSSTMPHSGVVFDPTVLLPDFV
jgi:hypothetical protein